MKKFLFVLVVAAIATPAATAGGWATVGLSSLPPAGLEANQTWSVDITVLQHGLTPLVGVTPIVRIRDSTGKLAKSITAPPTDTAGASHAEVTFPGQGTYTYEVYDGFTQYGGAQTHTFSPVEIGPAGDSFPYLPLGLVVALALCVAAAAIVHRRRDRPEPTAVTELTEAA